MSNEVIRAAAKRLGFDVNLALAIKQVEAKGSGFLPSGRPKILFERHVFYRALKRRGHDLSTLMANGAVGPDILASRPYSQGKNDIPSNKYGSYSQQWDRFNRAAAIDIESAIEAISMGAYQVLGENYKMLGFDSPKPFFNMMQTEVGQDQVFIRYLENKKGMVEALRQHDFNTIKILYNGRRSYDLNHDGIDDYQYKLTTAYSRLMHQNLPGKRLRDSRTQTANAADVVGKTVVLSSVAVAGDNATSMLTTLSQYQEVTTMAQSVVSSIMPFLGSVNGSYVTVGLFGLFTLVPNARVLYTYMHDKGYFNA